jgi:hypothetical protein
MNPLAQRLQQRHTALFGRPIAGEESRSPKAQSNTEHPIAAAPVPSSTSSSSTLIPAYMFGNSQPSSSSSTSTSATIATTNIVTTNTNTNSNLNANANASSTSSQYSRRVHFAPEIQAASPKSPDASLQLAFSLIKPVSVSQTLTTAPIASPTSSSTAPTTLSNEVPYDGRLQAWLFPGCPLTTIDLSHLLLAEHDCGMLAKFLISAKTVRKLVLDSTDVSDRHIWRILDALLDSRTCSLDVLSLRGNMLRGSILDHKCLRAGRVKCLYLDHNADIAVDALERLLSDATGMATFEELSFGGIRFSQDSLVSLCNTLDSLSSSSTSQRSPLRMLGFRGCGIKSPNEAIFAHVVKCLDDNRAAFPHFQLLDIALNHMSPKRLDLPLSLPFTVDFSFNDDFAYPPNLTSSLPKPKPEEPVAKQQRDVVPPAAVPALVMESPPYVAVAESRFTDVEPVAERPIAKSLSVETDDRDRPLELSTLNSPKTPSKMSAINADWKRLYEREKKLRHAAQDDLDVVQRELQQYRHLYNVERKSSPRKSKFGSSTSKAASAASAASTSTAAVKKDLLKFENEMLRKRLAALESVCSLQQRYEADRISAQGNAVLSASSSAAPGGNSSLLIPPPRGADDAAQPSAMSITQEARLVEFEEALMRRSQELDAVTAGIMRYREKIEAVCEALQKAGREKDARIRELEDVLRTRDMEHERWLVGVELSRR